MPTDKFKDLHNESRQLLSSRAPRSPSELDEKIIQHARQQAEQYAEYSSSVGFKWLGDGWKAAVAVFSVAAIAISVTLQIYDNSRTTPFIASRAVPDAEVANVDIEQSELLAPADLQVQLLAEPPQRNFELERNRQAPASPVTRGAGVTAEATFRAQEAQAQAQADSPNFFPDVAEPGLVELLLFIDSLDTVESTDQATMITNISDPLRIVLNILEESFNEASVEVETYPPPDSPPTIPQLAGKADALVNTYNIIENDQLRVQLESDYQQRRQTYAAVDLPPTIEITVNVLENWLAGR